MVAELIAAIIGAGIDAAYFPTNLWSSLLTIIPDLIWLIYFFKSTRVRHVFRLHDWNVVDAIYPIKNAAVI